MPKKRYNAGRERWSKTGSWNRSLRFRRRLTSSLPSHDSPQAFNKEKGCSLSHAAHFASARGGPEPTGF
jgi:hypothetical protein